MNHPKSSGQPEEVNRPRGPGEQPVYDPVHDCHRSGPTDQQWSDGVGHWVGDRYYAGPEDFNGAGLDVPDGVKRQYGLPTDEPRIKTSGEPATDSLPIDPGPPWATIGAIGKLPEYRTGLTPVTTRYTCLDDALRGGFRPDCLYTLPGRTASAKTTLASNMARRIALCGHSVLLFKLEESSLEATWRFHAAAAQVDFKVLLDGASRATESEREQLADGWELIRTLPIRVSPCRELGAIRRVSRAHVEDGGKLIIIDQLSMIQTEGADVGFPQATMASNALRLLAVELHVPILLVVQINRAASKGSEHLTCHDLRDSGAIENDSAAVILIDKVRAPDHVWAGSELTRYVDLIIGKNRYGPTTDPDKPITLTWFPRFCRIEEGGGAA